MRYRTQLLVIGAFMVLAGCGPDESFFIYRLPYADDTEIAVTNDHTTHNNRLDLTGINGESPYAIVAARPGIVRFIRDGGDEVCAAGEELCPNNYVWIQHEPGEEWSKYSHLAEGTVTGAAGLSEGDAVVAGQYLGDEGNIGMVSGVTGIHLHFQVSIPDDPNPPKPTTNVGNFAGLTHKAPRLCNVAGGLVMVGENYTAAPCPN